MIENPYIERLRLLKPHFADMNIRRLRVFGSQARGDARPDSDIDLLVEFDKPMGYVGYSDLQLKLQDILQKKIDLVTEDALIPEFKDKILREASDV